ncbi:MAG: SPOR domain-containing protein [Tannerellaceae bacterium]|nr:SPOR domain-containing protein [Tannerellaceae bacterium]
MNKIWLFGAALSMVLAFGSCKPKQSAYKAAYEQAKEKESTAPVEVFEEEEVVTVSKPKPSDEPTRQEKIQPVEGENADGLKRFSVVIGSFKNRTNAYSLKERMQNDGYNPLLGENEEGMLRVIVTSFNDKSDAVDSREAIKAKYAPNFQDAWILERQY